MGRGLAAAHRDTMNIEPKLLAEVTIAALSLAAGLQMTFFPKSWVRGNVILLMMSPQAESANMWPVRVQGIMVLALSLWFWYGIL